MKYLIVGDIHLEESAIEEINDIFENDIFSIKADCIVQLGDFFHYYRPTPKELYFATSLIKRMNEKYDNVIVLKGNGRHETFNGYNIVNYFEYFNVEVPKDMLEIEIDKKKCLFGHFMFSEASYAHGTGRFKVAELDGYDYVLAGHQHSFEKLTDYAIQLGSIRYTDFGDNKKESKKVAIINNGKLTFKDLKHCIPMVDVSDIRQLETLDSKTKIRFVFYDYQTFINTIDKFNDIKSKFYLVGEPVLNFKTITEAKVKERNKPETIEDSIKKIENKDIKELILSVLDKGVKI